MLPAEKRQRATSIWVKTWFRIFLAIAIKERRFIARKMDANFRETSTRDLDLGQNLIFNFADNHHKRAPNFREKMDVARRETPMGDLDLSQN